MAWYCCNKKFSLINAFQTVEIIYTSFQSQMTTTQNSNKSQSYILQSFLVVRLGRAAMVLDFLPVLMLKREKWSGLAATICVRIESYDPSPPFIPTSHDKL